MKKEFFKVVIRKWQWLLFNCVCVCGLSCVVMQTCTSGGMAIPAIKPIRAQRMMKTEFSVDTRAKGPIDPAEDTAGHPVEEKLKH